MATDFVKERRYTEAVSIFEELARNNEHDAQYNLAFLINGGKLIFHLPKIEILSKNNI